MRFVLVTLFLALLAQAAQVDVKAFAKLPMFASPEVKLTRAFDHGSLYEVEFISPSRQGMTRYTAYITKDKKAFIMGAAFAMNDQSPLKMPLEGIAAMKKGADIKVGSGKEELIVITDPECHYCQIFQKRWKSLMKRYTLYVYLYPLSHHSQAMQMSYYVMHQKSAKAKIDALLKIAKGEKNYILFQPSADEKKRFDTKFQQNMNLGARLGVRGTPSVFDFSGSFINWSSLEP